MQLDLPPKDALGVHSEVLGSREWVKKETLVIFAQSNQQEWIYIKKQQKLLHCLKGVSWNFYLESEVKFDKEF